MNSEMKVFYSILMIAIFLGGLLSPTQSLAKDCSCPQVTCGPCQKKVSVGKIVKFCDWGDINVCKKVICENVNFYFGCISKHTKSLKELNKTEMPKEDLDLVYDTEKKEDKKRKLASKGLVQGRGEKIKLETDGRIEVGNESRVDPGVTYSDVVIGEVTKFGPGLKVLHHGKLSAFSKNQKLFVGDEIVNEAQKNEALNIEFPNGKVSVEIKTKSKLIVHDPHSILGRFQPFLYLVHGGVEYVVDMKEGSFDLLAGQILTRMEKGKLLVTYEMGAEGLKVKVESQKGVAQVIRAQDLSGKSIEVRQGNFVSWVSETPKNLFTMDEKQALVDEGFITPVFEMSFERKKQLGLTPPEAKALFADWSQREAHKDGKGRQVASIGNELCQAPAAKFQQCAWTCEGNGKGAKSCQAQADTVHCVRRVCNAAGQWGNPTAFASSYADLCPAEGTRVGDCTP